MKKIFEISILILFFGTLTAQCLIRDFSIKERSELSNYITSALVVDKYSFKDDNDGHIYTLYTLEELETKKNIHLSIRGGKYENIIEVVNPSLTLNISDQGIFYLTNAPDVQSQKNVFAPAIGILSFLQYDIEKNVFYDYKNEYSIDVFGFKYTSCKDDNNSNVSGISLSPPVINSITPSVVTAGTEQVLTIKGYNFGNNAIGSALLEFRNPDYASGTVKAYQSVSPDHILSWKNNKIEVIVPGRDPYIGKSGAGSGNIRLRNTLGEIIYSTQEIKVISNQFVKGIKPTLLVNDNSFGGYSLRYNNEFKDNTQATLAFERAIESWQCGIHSSYVITGSTDNGTCPVNDGINLISFEKDCSLSPELLAQTTHWYITCSGENTILLETDIIFDKDVFWHFDTTSPPSYKFDFESIVLHELGHAHGLAHVLEESSIMFPNYFLEEEKRIIDDNSLDGGVGIIDISSKFNNCTDVDSFIPFPDCSLPCSLSGYAVQFTDCDVDGYLEYNITVIDTNGGVGFQIYKDDILYTTDTLSYKNWGQTTVKVKLLGDETIHIIKIQDVSDNNCWFELQVTPKNCMCSLDISLTQISNCNEEGLVTYVLEIEDNNGSENGFEVMLDGVLTQTDPYFYSVSGNTFINIDILGDELEHTVDVKDLVDINCHESISINTPNCLCQLSLNLLDADECNNEDSIKYSFLVTSTNAGSSGFNVLVDDQLIIHSPYLSSDTTPFFIWIVGDGNEHDISVVDNEKEICEASLSITTENCICDISLGILQNGDCNDEGLIEYLITINQLSISNDSFNLTWNGSLVGASPFPYDPSGITVVSYWAEGNGLIHELTFVDHKNTTCIINKTIIVPNCKCELSVELKTLSDCIEDGNINYQVIIKNTNQNATSFNIYLDGVLSVNSPFLYLTDSTIIDFLLIGDGLDHTIMIEDIFTQNCNELIITTTLECTCALSLTATQISECDENNKSLWSLEISDLNSSSAGFDVYLDGTLVDFEGYLYTSPKTFIDIVVDGDGLIHEILIQDKKDELCLAQLEIMTEKCSCNLSLEATIADCDDEFYVEVTGIIMHNNVPSDIYYVLIDGVKIELSFLYGNSGFSSFKLFSLGDGKTHTIGVVDSQENDCSASTTIQLPTCYDSISCQLQFTAFQIETCLDDKYSINMQFNGPKEPLHQYEIEINDVKTFTSTYHASGVNTLTLKTSCEKTKITIRDLQNDACVIDTIIHPKIPLTMFSVYPNLLYTDNINLTIEGIESEDYDRILPLAIYNVIGENIYNNNILGSSIMKINIDSDKMSSGIYYLLMGSKEQYKSKLIVIR